MWTLAGVLACRNPVAIEIQPVATVMDHQSVTLRATVLDARRQPIDRRITWTTAGGIAIVEGGGLRCVRDGEETVRATAGPVTADVLVTCRPGAAFDGVSERLRLVVGELRPPPAVRSEGTDVAVGVTATSSRPDIVASEGDGTLVGRSVGRATVRFAAGTLGTEATVDVVAALASDRVYLRRPSEAGWELVDVDGGGAVRPLATLDGYVPEEDVPCTPRATAASVAPALDERIDRRACRRDLPLLVDLGRARVAWVRATGERYEVVAIDLPGRPTVLGPASPDGQLGLVGGAFVWVAPDGALIAEGGAPVAQLPAGARFVGTGATGQPCWLDARDQALACAGPEGSVLQPRDDWFEALVDGGSASLWSNLSTCAKGYARCPVVLSLHGDPGPWRRGTSGTADLPPAAIANRRAARSYPALMALWISVEGTNWDDAVVYEVRVAGTELEDWEPVALSPDGQLVLHRPAVTYLGGRPVAGRGSWAVSPVDEVIARQRGRRTRAVDANRVDRDLTRSVGVLWRR
ncbi:MAG: hypothetical protein ABMB14_32765 [Myxococcota bacterium]